MHTCNAPAQSLKGLETLEPLFYLSVYVVFYQLNNKCLVYFVLFGL